MLDDREVMPIGKPFEEIHSRIVIALAHQNAAKMGIRREKWAKQ